jgi:hypothetical protein
MRKAKAAALALSRMSRGGNDAATEIVCLTLLLATVVLALRIARIW